MVLLPAQNLLPCFFSSVSQPKDHQLRGGSSQPLVLSPPLSIISVSVTNSNMLFLDSFLVSLCWGALEVCLLHSLQKQQIQLSF